MGNSSSTETLNPQIFNSDQTPSLVESTTNNVVSDQSNNVLETPEPTIENVPEATEEEKQPQQDEGEGGEIEEEGECGFCIFMKGGGCKDAFTTWETCIEVNKDDIVDKCFEATRLLRICMEAHSDYYEPLLRAEKEAEAVAVKELEKETQDNLNDGDQNEIASGGDDDKAGAADADAVADSEKNEEISSDKAV